MSLLLPLSFPHLTFPASKFHYYTEIKENCKNVDLTMFSASRHSVDIVLRIKSNIANIVYKIFQLLISVYLFRLWMFQPNWTFTFSQLPSSLAFKALNTLFSFTGMLSTLSSLSFFTCPTFNLLVLTFKVTFIPQDHLRFLCYIRSYSSPVLPLS